MPRKIEMVGSKFYRLKVVKFVGVDKRRESLWECVCECGGSTIALGYNLRSGNTKSCGCWNIEKIIERSKQHGMSKERIYKIWVGVRKRCYNPKMKSYAHYGGKGITMADSWSDFEVFYADTKEGYSENLTLDRWPDKNGNYEPGNVRWATQKTQQNNRTNNRIISLNGAENTLAQWAEISGVNSCTISWRIKNGWDIKKAIFTAVDNEDGDISKYLSF